MLALLAEYSDQFLVFNLLRYLTFRSVVAAATAFTMTILLGGFVIQLLTKLYAGVNTIRVDVPETHLKKQHTPSMGGVLIIASTSLAVVLCGDLTNALLGYALMITLAFSGIGALDDIYKLRGKNGLRARTKFGLQLVIGLIGVWLLAKAQPEALRYYIAFPFFKDFLLFVGPVLFALFGTVVIVGGSNAVNLTDGLDGLAAGAAAIAFGTFALIAYLVGHAVYADYLQLHPIAGSGELAVFCSAFIGALLGFLWFNSHPASVFMGDTGSLAIGAGLGTTAIATKNELVLAIAGGLFVIETLSVMIQVGVFKLTRKRVFRIAPLHHHLEKCGWPESRIIVRLWIVALIFAALALTTLKLR